MRARALGAIKLCAFLISACGTSNASGTTSRSAEPPSERPPLCEPAEQSLTMQQLVETDESEGAPDDFEAADRALSTAGHGIREIGYLNWVASVGLVAVRAGDIAVLAPSEGELTVRSQLSLPAAANGAGGSAVIIRAAASNLVGSDGPEMWIEYSVGPARQIVLIELSPLRVLERSTACEPTLFVGDRDCDGQREARIDSGC